MADWEEAKQKLVEDLIKARKEQGLSQQRLSELSGVRQPIIARTEAGHTDPRTSTFIKLLLPLGKKLAIVPF